MNTCLGENVEIKAAGWSKSMCFFNVLLDISSDDVF